MAVRYSLGETCETASDCEPQRCPRHGEPNADSLDRLLSLVRWRHCPCGTKLVLLSLYRHDCLLHLITSCIVQVHLVEHKRSLYRNFNISLKARPPTSIHSPCKTTRAV